MLPVLTFASGLIAGIVGVQMLKKAKLADRPDPAARLDKAQAGLRQAAVSGLAAVEKSSACLRAKLTPAETPDVAAPAEPVAADATSAADGDAPARERDA